MGQKTTLTLTQREMGRNFHRVIHIPQMQLPYRSAHKFRERTETTQTQKIRQCLAQAQGAFLHKGGLKVVCRTGFQIPNIFTDSTAVLMFYSNYVYVLHVSVEWMWWAAGECWCWWPFGVRMCVGQREEHWLVATTPLAVVATIAAAVEVLKEDPSHFICI